jgi:hypothetical protein
MRIRVASVAAVRRLLAARDVAAIARGPQRLDVRPSEAAGARIVFVQ